MRLADHQPQWAELEAAGGISPKPAIWRRAGAARRSAGAAGAALLRRQQGAVVRDHRRPAAISGLSAARLRLDRGRVGDVPKMLSSAYAWAIGPAARRGGSMARSCRERPAFSPALRAFSRR